jgi:hypothetical protein
MSWKGHCKSALFALALASLIAPQAEAIEIFTGTNPATHVNDDLIMQVRGGRGGGAVHRGGGGMHRGGSMHRGGAYGGMHRPGGAYGGNVNRNINRNVNRNVNRAGYGYRGGAVWAGRPGWYRWPAGGALAAGAAIGFVGAASAAAWAGAPPSAGLCWYYTDSTQRNGFWDNCP